MLLIVAMSLSAAVWPQF